MNWDKVTNRDGVIIWDGVMNWDGVRVHKLLIEQEVKVAGYWPSYFLQVPKPRQSCETELWTEEELWSEMELWTEKELWTDMELWTEMESRSILTINQAWSQGGWLLAKFFFAGF